MRLNIVLYLLLTCFAGQAATVLRIACGHSGGTDLAGNAWQADTYYAGGARWDAVNQPALAAMDLPYRALRYSNPAGGTVSYSVPLLPGNYTLKLYLQEPNKTAAGQRTFDVRVNGATIHGKLDVFAEAGGALKPYVVTAAVTATGTPVQLTLAPSLGNAVLSGIQVDTVDAPPPPPPISGCEFGLGDGSGAMFSIFGALPPRHLVGCWNNGKVPRSIESVRCWSDGTQDNILDVMVMGADGLQSVLSAPILCPALEDAAIVPAIAGATLPPNRRLHFMVRIAAPTPPQISPTEIVWVVDFSK